MKTSLKLLISICLFFSSSFILAEESESTEVVIVLILYDQADPYEGSQVFLQQMEDNPSFPYAEVRDTTHNKVMARVGLLVDDTNVISLPEGDYCIDIWRSETWHVLLTGPEDKGHRFCL